ncbi:restriction endonuclease subunit S [Aeromonas caviae]|uniref:restriction endonuclease subunit S n=1 Tax=Aeromonas caviae TaxID=648 RepID=UPI0023D9A189|nr:restriction endonuclease subunit S [Aeromonas caviae]MDF2274064.1 restriction endonuclease subunit S [Aeromonas caviae]
MAEQMMQHKPAKQTIPAGYKQTEVGVIPEDWDVKSIGETMTLINGYGFKPYQWMREGLPIIRIQNLNDDDAPFNYYDGIVDSRFYINEGDLLFAWSGSKGSSFGARVWSGPRAILNQHIFKVVANNSFVESDFAYLILRSVQEDIEKKAHGFKSSFVHVKKGDLENTELPIPPKQEQTAIANVLLDSDALIDALEQLIAKKQAIKTAVMQQLLTGRARLPQFALRPDGTPKGYKTSELGQIPEDWDALTYGDIFTFLSTATNSRADLSNSGDFGYIHYGDIHTKWNNKLDLCVFDLPRVSRHLVSSSFVENGDVIMADASEDYDGIGKSVEICNVGDDKIVSGLHTFLLRDKNKLLVDGYRGFLHSIPAVKKAFDRLATGMKVYGISKNNLIVVPVPLPPKQEQTAIATILTDMDSELTALEQKLAKARDVKQGMMQQLLTGRIRLPLPQEA